MDNSTLQTQYWEPMGPAGVGVMVYAMDPGGSSSRQSVGQEDRDKPQCWEAPNILSALELGTEWPQAEPLALSYTRDLSHEAFLAPSPRCPEWEPSGAPTTCCEFAP